MADRKRKLKSIDEPTAEGIADLREIKKLSDSLFPNEQNPQSSSSSATEQAQRDPVLEDVIEVKELISSEVIVTIEDLVMKFVQQILQDGSCESISLPLYSIALISISRHDGPK
jgi:hypothetical protein